MACKYGILVGLVGCPSVMENQLCVSSCSTR